MERTMHDERHNHDQTEPDDHLALSAKQRVLALAHLPALERHRAVLGIATAEGWGFWRLGGFCFEDGSVLSQRSAGWQTLNPQQAYERLCTHLKRPLEVRLLHTFEGRDGRGKGSIAEARFSLIEPSGRWQLVVEYEAFMDSPLYGLRADCFADLLELPLWDLCVDTPQPSQRWQLEQIALHPDWLELLNVSKGPSGDVSTR
jgi:hypothetical protein